MRNSSNILLNDARVYNFEPDLVKDVPNNAVGSPEISKDIAALNKKEEKNSEGDKKHLAFIRSFFNCLAPIISIFKPKSKVANDVWEIPFEEICELQWIASGAQGAVFLGKWRGEDVAIKKVRTQRDTDIKHLKELDHCNIVKFRGVCSISPSYCLVMEFCPYGQLYDAIRSGKEITPTLLVNWARQIAEGMSYLHIHKIIHRDLKSPNVLISQNETLKITDFGTWKPLAEKSAKMTFTGTVAWMAPEVIRNEPCSEKVDVWSYGVLIWELLTEEVPYKGVDYSALIWGVGNNSLKLPVPASCPEGFKLLLSLCWNSKAKNRPTFRQILMHITIAASDVLNIPKKKYLSQQVGWKKEVDDYFDWLKAQGSQLTLDGDLIKKRQEEILQVRLVREQYEERLLRANELYKELNECMRQVRKRERELKKKELNMKFYDKTDQLLMSRELEYCRRSVETLPQISDLKNCVNSYEETFSLKNRTKDHHRRKQVHKHCGREHNKHKHKYKKASFPSAKQRSNSTISTQSADAILEESYRFVEEMGGENYTDNSFQTQHSIRKSPSLDSVLIFRDKDGSVCDEECSFEQTENGHDLEWDLHEENLDRVRDVGGK